MSHSSGEKQYPATNKSPKIPILGIHRALKRARVEERALQGRVNDEVKNNHAAERRKQPQFQPARPCDRIRATLEATNDAPFPSVLEKLQGTSTSIQSFQSANSA
jgi:hypothetical protein